MWLECTGAESKEDDVDVLDVEVVLQAEHCELEEDEEDEVEKLLGLDGSGVAALVGALAGPGPFLVADCCGGRDPAEESALRYF